jgi:hypothetical protein
MSLLKAAGLYPRPDVQRGIAFPTAMKAIKFSNNALPNNCRMTGGSGKCKSLQAALIITASVVKSDSVGIGQVATKTN